MSATTSPREKACGERDLTPVSAAAALAEAAYYAAQHPAEEVLEFLRDLGWELQPAGNAVRNARRQPALLPGVLTEDEEFVLRTALGTEPTVAEVVRRFVQHRHVPFGTDDRGYATGGVACAGGDRCRCGLDRLISGLEQLRACHD